MVPATLPPAKVLLIGVGGKTGHWYARLLLARGHQVIGFDRNPNVILPGDILNHPAFTLANEAEERLLSRYQPEAITLTPGVPLSLPIFSLAQAQGILLFTEVEFTAPMLCDKYRMVGITGTDGKSTTTALTAAILNQMGEPALACGNYGIPFSQILLEADKFAGIRNLVAELSSYQLEHCQGLELDVALYLNLAPDHLDRYPSLADYCLAKWNIYFALKNNGTLIINKKLLPGEDTILGERHPFRNPKNQNIKIIAVNTQELKSDYFYFAGNHLKEGGSHLILASENDFLLKGRHNQSNILFALEAVKVLLPETNSSQMVQAARQFGGLPHRYEILPSADSNLYINDSKATTTQAAITALRCSPPPVFMFLGGRGKGESYEELARETFLKQATCFVYGTEKDKLSSALKISGTEHYVFHDLQTAFHAARRLQQQKNIPRVTYLLAPAVTSWDQFSSFEERGDFFRSLVQSL